MSNNENKEVTGRCLDHKEVLARLKALEENVKDLRILMKEKVDSKLLEEIIERRAQEIEELRQEIARLAAVDDKHSQSIAGIHAVMEGFKEVLKGLKDSQELMREDVKKMSDSYAIQSNTLSAITAILKERATTQVQTQDSGGKDPWYIKLLNKNSTITFALATLILAIAFILLTQYRTILETIKIIFK